jgi:hypothetical protein
MKYFVKLVDGQPNGEPVPETSSLIESDWVEFDMPMWPQNGHVHTIGPITQVDGVWSAEWVQVNDGTYDKKTVARARQERENRDARIKAIEWRYARYERNARTGAAQQDDLFTLDAYVQALADVPTQVGFPWDIQWPEYNP